MPVVIEDYGAAGSRAEWIVSCDGINPTNGECVFKPNPESAFKLVALVTKLINYKDPSPSR